LESGFPAAFLEFLTVRGNYGSGYLFALRSRFEAGEAAAAGLARSLPEVHASFRNRSNDGHAIICATAADSAGHSRGAATTADAKPITTAEPAGKTRSAAEATGTGSCRASSSSTSAAAGDCLANSRDEFRIDPGLGLGTDRRCRGMRHRAGNAVRHRRDQVRR
jgi:hypothetical protein